MRIEVYKILTFAFLGGMIVFGTSLFFSWTGNRALKQEKKQLEKQVEEDLKVIEELNKDLEKWNNIIKLNIDEKYITDSLSNDFDSRAKFLSKFLSGSTDSLAK